MNPHCGDPSRTVSAGYVCLHLFVAGLQPRTVPAENVLSSFRKRPVMNSPYRRHPVMTCPCRSFPDTKHLSKRFLLRRSYSDHVLLWDSLCCLCWRLWDRHEHSTVTSCPSGRRPVDPTYSRLLLWSVQTVYRRRLVGTVHTLVFRDNPRKKSP